MLFKITTKNYERLPGILNSPFCILYGFGTVICSFIAQFVQSIILQFVLCFFLLSLIEYITYDLLYNVYKIKLWDYSKLKINIKGKVSLIFSLAWAFLGIIIIQFLIPVLNNWFYLNNNIALKIILLVFITYISWDFLVSSRRLLNIDENYSTQKHTVI